MTERRTNPLLIISRAKATDRQKLLSIPDENLYKHNPQDSEDVEPYNWTDDAACRGRSSDMFPRSHKDISYISTARAICKSCPVKEPCLDYALQWPATDMHGVWGGLSPRQLAAEQQRRGIEPEEIRPTIAAIWSDFERIEKAEAARREQGLDPLDTDTD